jgi:hypothetical protein
MNMTRLSVLLVMTLLACSGQKTEDKPGDSIRLAFDKDTVKTTVVAAERNDVYMLSTYDDPGSDLRIHKTGLKELADSNVFSVLHDQLLVTMDAPHKDYFASKPDYQILESTRGDIFLNNASDNVFVVYDKVNSRISFLLYDASNNTYSELFRDVNVKNALENADCNYGAFGTLDYQFGNELVYKPESFFNYKEVSLEDFHCKVVDLLTDDDIALESGCMAEGFSAKAIKCLCIPTSSVYNNWECMVYDKEKNDFTIFYGQAFAD